VGKRESGQVGKRGSGARSFPPFYHPTAVPPYRLGNLGSIGIAVQDELGSNGRPPPRRPDQSKEQTVRHKVTTAGQRWSRRGLSTLRSSVDTRNKPSFWRKEKRQGIPVFVAQ
jgi:hypothetical protein